MRILFWSSVRCEPCQCNAVALGSEQLFGVHTNDLVASGPPLAVDLEACHVACRCWNS